MKKMSVFKRLSSAVMAAVMASCFACGAAADILDLEYGEPRAYAAGEYDSSLSRVVDAADLISDNEERKLEDKIEGLIDDYDFDCVIVTVDSYRDINNSSSIMAFADDFYDYLGYGVGEECDGIIFVVSMSQREYAIVTTGFGMEAVSDSYGIGWIEDDILDDLSDGDYYKCFSAFVGDVYDFVKEARENRPYGTGHTKLSFKGFLDNWFAALIIALIITAVTASVLISQMKTVLPQPAAKEYLKNYKERYSQDTFLYSNVTKVRRESDSGSGGGGGGHIGSSGTSHGGHSGRF